MLQSRSPQPLPPIYTVGYGRRKPEDFLALLAKHDIHYLVDIRTYPSSKFNPAFSRNQLKGYLAEMRINYVFMGDVLGGRPEETEFYTSEGKVDYTKLRTSLAFLHGIDRLLIARGKALHCVLMCSEERPEQCHRAKLVGEVLYERGAEICHIDEVGVVHSQSDIMARLYPKKDQQMLMFGDAPATPLTSRKRYRPSIGVEKEH